MNLVDGGFPVRIPEKILELEPELISQGAEALLFVVKKPEDSERFIAKYRPPKPYRIYELDSLLRKRRTTAEARVMKKLAQNNVKVPELLSVDPQLGLLYMELIAGECTLKKATWDAESIESVIPHYSQLGAAIERMHSLAIVHGDLTTSNVMLTPDNKIALIDFGLSSQAANIEDKAVDLYVLERAIQSTHPSDAEYLMRILLEGYVAEGLKLQDDKQSLVLQRLEKVRQRGRKRTDLG